MLRQHAIIADLLHACAHPAVADAALFALSDATVERARISAAGRSQSLGAFVACQVADFARDAGPCDHARLARRMRGASTPIVAGLEAILENKVQARYGVQTRGSAR